MHKNLKILVVDDDKDTRQLLYKILNNEGYNVSTAATGKEALAYISTDNLDIVITDLRMPEADGMEVLTKARSISPACHVILLTAYADLPVYLEAFKEGVFDVIRKPFSTSDILDCIQRAKVPKLIY